MLRAGALAVAIAVGAVAMPGMAHASQWNNISQTLNGTYWTQENQVRSVTNNTDIYLDISNLPGCCLDIQLRNANGSGEPVFAWKYNMQGIQQYTIATGVLSGTRFKLEGRNTINSSDRWWAGRLYY